MKTTNNYIGIFRCDCEKSSDGNFYKENEEIEEDESHIYICTKREGQVYRFNKEILVFYCPSIKAGNKIYEKLNELKLVEDFDSGDSEVRIYFLEKDLMQISKIIGCFTKGKDEIPFNPKSEKTANNFDYNIYVNGKLKKKNLSLLKANILLDKYRKEFGYDSVKKEIIK